MIKNPSAYNNGKARLPHDIHCFVLMPAFKVTNSKNQRFATPPPPHFAWKLGPGFHDTGLPLEIGARFEARARGTEPPTFRLQAWAATNYAKFGRPAHPYIFVHIHSLRPQPGKSETQTPNFVDLDGGLDGWGIWVWDCGSGDLGRGFGLWIGGFGWGTLVWIARRPLDFA